jgi:hypothetical protein
VRLHGFVRHCGSAGSPVEVSGWHHTLGVNWVAPVDFDARVPCHGTPPAVSRLPSVCGNGWRLWQRTARRGSGRCSMGSRHVMIVAGQAYFGAALGRAWRHRGGLAVPFDAGRPAKKVLGVASSVPNLRPGLLVTVRGVSAGRYRGAACAQLTLWISQM